MDFKQIFSSSSGNLYTLSANGERLLIECGVTWGELTKALEYDLKDIVGCLVTHSHQDHCKAASEVAKSGITVYSSHRTLRKLDLLDDRRAVALPAGEWHKVGGFDVLPFYTNHDVPDPFGYIITHGKESMLFMTDTSHLDYTFKTQFHIVAIECSFNREYLQKRVDNGSIHSAVADRLLLSHMS